MALARAGYTVSLASNGLLALEQLRARLPDILITDIEMPKMDGQQLLETVAAEYPEREFPIFIMTSRTNLEYRTWSEQFDNLYFMEKPVSTRRLITVLDEWLKEAVSS